MDEPLIRSLSDTARWVAYHRATESDRSDRLFNDPYACRLAGERGALIGRKLHENAWAIAVRTFLFDRAISELLSRKPIDMVLNLAAGLDSRPYRLPLPSSLQWVEVDLPEIVEPKRQLLVAEKPHCQLEILTEHLGDEARRRILFSELNQRAQCIMVMTEGLLSYLNEDKVTALAADLHAQPHFRYWLVEVMAPNVLAYVDRKWGKHLAAANAKMAFAPADWRKFYRERGWELESFADMAQTAFQKNRGPSSLKLIGIIRKLFPAWYEKRGQLWESGVALLHPA
jgi:methyltransferase (TIGR00027 family)